MLVVCTTPLQCWPFYSRGGSYGSVHELQFAINHTYRYALRITHSARDYNKAQKLMRKMLCDVILASI